MWIGPEGRESKTIKRAFQHPSKKPIFAMPQPIIKSKARIFGLLNLLVTLLTSFPINAQLGAENHRCGKPVICPLPAEDPAHKDPYFNGHLCENFNPKQADFSQEYYSLQMEKYKSLGEQLAPLHAFDFADALVSGPVEQNGIIGLDYERIRFHFDSLKKHPTILGAYTVYGKSRVKDNVCRFAGEIQLLNLFLVGGAPRNDGYAGGNMLGSYTLWEDSVQFHSGWFQGVFEAAILLNVTSGKMELEQQFEDADGYSNRTFVGIWTSFDTKEAVKCIWGDYRLPFVFDFDEGDGERYINEKYRKNGWEPFLDPTRSAIKKQDTWWIK
jgi:hypothetical protein